jgi:hypothetical protein
MKDKKIIIGQNPDTFESIDSYVYPNKMFQVAISRRHKINQDGLRAIKEILDGGDSEINIYFVLPRDIFEKFKTKHPYVNKIFEQFLMVYLLGLLFNYMCKIAFLIIIN